MKFAINYEAIFRDRLIILTGVGRSGTTIVGKILGSMAGTYYLFEPSILKYQVKNGYLDLPLLFEDYFLPIIQGRHINYNKADDTYFKYYTTEDNLKARWGALSRRKDAIEYVRSTRPYFIIKCPEFQPLSNPLKKLVPSVRFVNVIRNVEGVVNSAVNKGWYSDGFVPVEWNEGLIPYFIDLDCREHWSGWNLHTRAACVWRCLTQIIMPLGTITVTYENFVAHPIRTINKIINTIGLEYSTTTKRTIGMIENRTRPIPSLTPFLDETEKEKLQKILDK